MIKVNIYFDRLGFQCLVQYNSIGMLQFCAGIFESSTAKETQINISRSYIYAATLYLH